MEPGEIMYYNWNRIVLLSRMDQTEDINNERTMRIAFQNSFACQAGDDITEHCLKVIAAIEETISPEIIRSVDLFMK